jgi:predicted DNA-binding protein
MCMKTTAIRLPPDQLAKLRALAHQESLRTGQEVTWSSLVRKAVEAQLFREVAEGVATTLARQDAPETIAS